MGGHGRKAQYPKQVWHPFGGKFPHPRDWKKHTNIATLIMALTVIPIIYYAEKHTVSESVSSKEASSYCPAFRSITNILIIRFLGDLI